jgi:hypothetical protein
MRSKAMRILSGFKVALAQLGPQPNRRSSEAMALGPSEVPGSGWKIAVQQNLRAHAFKESNPVIRGAKRIQSTTTRRLFESDTNPGTLIVEITPLANEADAESWVASAGERTRKGLSKIVDVSDYRSADEMTLPDVGHVSRFEYSIEGRKGKRISLCAAAKSGRVFVLITGSSFDQTLTWSLVTQALSAQLLKIEKARRAAGS